MKRLLLAALLAAWGLSTARADQIEQQAADEAAVRKAVDAYVAAFNQADAKGLAALWSPEAVYINPQSGEQAVGRGAIETQFAAVFADAKGTKLEAHSDAIQFVSPNVAIERGTAKVSRPDQSLEESTYSAVYTKRDGQWLLDRVTEEDIPVAVSQPEQLRELEWMIGDWVDHDDQNTIETKCQWTKNRRFMIRSFAIKVRDRVDLAGMQIVGWDPAAQRIRSWVFDSDGGFGEGFWKKHGQAWHIRTTGILPDGQRSSAVNIITPVNEGSFTWQSVDREAGGELLPSVDEVLVVRQETAD